MNIWHFLAKKNIAILDQPPRSRELAIGAVLSYPPNPLHKVEGIIRGPVLKTWGTELLIRILPGMHEGWENALDCWADFIKGKNL